MKRAFLLLTIAACAGAPVVAPTPEGTVAAAAPQARDDAREFANGLRLITARVRRGDGAFVRQEYGEIIKQHPNDVRYKLFLSWAGSPSDESWQEINRIDKINPEEAWPKAMLGLIYLQWKGFVDQADGQFDRALVAKKGFVPALIGKADVLRARGKFEEARAAYEAILEATPGWEEALLGLGLAQVALKDPAARATLEKTLAIDPDDFVAESAVARLVFEGNDVEASLHHYEKLLHFSPKDRALRLGRAKLLEQKGDLAAATTDYEAAQALGIDLPTTKTLVELYKKQNRADDEIKLLERIAQLEPTTVEPFMRIAELRRAENDNDGTEVALRAAAERKPDDPSIPLAIARLVKQKDELIPAIEAFRFAKSKGAAEADGELKELEAKAGLGTPPSGDVNRIYKEVDSRIRKMFQARLKENPNLLGGTLKMKVTVVPTGKASGVEILENSVKDDILAASAYFNLKDADYPKEKRTPTFEFVVATVKR